MENKVGQLAYVGDVWYEIIDQRYGTNDLTRDTGDSYLLYSKDYWIPDSMIKDIKNKE